MNWVEIIEKIGVPVTALGCSFWFIKYMFDKFMNKIERIEERQLAQDQAQWDALFKFMRKYEEN